MTEPAPGPLLDGLITITASASATHPEGADLTEHPDHTPDVDGHETEHH